MAVRESYQKRSMSELADAAAEIIRQQPGLRCGGIGDQLFGSSAVVMGSAPYARIAGKVMARLEREGRARYDPNASGGFGGWFIKP